MQLESEDLGLRHLKNLIKPVRVFRVLPPGARSSEVVAEARKARVMVLPLANSSGLPDETYLSEGIREEPHCRSVALRTFGCPGHGVLRRVSRPVT